MFLVSLMSFSKQLAAIRKEKGLSQSELADRVDSTSITIGRYERDEVKPPLEVAAKIAVVLGVSLDFLAGITDQQLDTDVVKRILDIQKMNVEDKAMIFSTIDALLRDAKTRKAYAQ